MTFDSDFHLHTNASDGRCTVSELVCAAKERGLKSVAVTDHSLSGLRRRSTPEKFEAQRAEIYAQEGITTLQGIEANIVSEDGEIDVPDEVIRRADVLIAGFHRFAALMRKSEARRFVFVNGFLSERERQKLYDVNTCAYLGLIERYPVDVIAHIGHRCPADFVRIAEACAAHGVYIELNERHIPDTRGLDERMGDMIATGVKFIVGSDAHRADRVGIFDNVADFIKRHDIPLDRVYGIDGNVPAFKDRSGWKK